MRLGARGQVDAQAGFDAPSGSPSTRQGGPGYPRVVASPVDVFISYAAEDDGPCKALEKLLSPLERDGFARVWCSRRAPAGRDLRDERDARLRAARVVVLLVTGDYLASDVLHAEEMLPSVERARKGEVIVIPVLVRPCDWQSAPFSHLSPLPPDGRAVTSWENQDEAWTEVVAGLRRAVGAPEGAKRIAAAGPVGGVHQLRAPPADFTGRKEELADLLAKIEGGATISGLRGQGGIGKTALALKLAEALAPRFPDAQIDIDLKGVSDAPLAPAAVMAEVIRALVPDARVPSDEGELGRMYRSALHGKRCLLLLDNAKDKAQVEPLLPPAGSVVIVTSRVRFALPGLVARDLDVLAEGDAVALLRRIAPRLDEDKASRIAELCGCLPLALTLAGGALAERIDMQPDEYVRRLEGAGARLDLVEASLSLSFDLLDPPLRNMWCRLGVFPGSFDREAALAVGKPEMEDGAKALSELVRHSMVRYDEAAKRYRLHDLARLYAVARLDEAERYAAERRHAEHFLGVARETSQLYKEGGASFDAGLGLFDREWENIHAGQAWAAGRAARDGDAAGLCEDYPDAAVHAIALRLSPRARIRWREAALDAARRLGKRGAEGAHLGNLGRAYQDLGEHQRAIELHEQHLDIARELGDRRGEGQALGNLGIEYAGLREFRRAVDLFEQCLPIMREIGDRRGEGMALGNLGLAYDNLREHRRAIEFYDQGRAIAREVGNKLSEAYASWNMGESYEALGEFDNAVEAKQICVDIFRAIRHPDAEMRTQDLDRVRAKLKP
jgi:tetratricopeptide (TPR) repeat protein